jgi:phospholipase C
MAGPQSDPIEHVVVLMLENRSFDQMLGDFQRLYPALDGIDVASPPRAESVAGHRYEQRPTTVRCASNDPNHELASVLRQIGAPAAVPGFDCRRPFLVRLFATAFLIVRSWAVWAWDWVRGRMRRPVMRAEARLVYESHFVAAYVHDFPDSTTTQRDEIMGYFPIDSLPALHLLAKHFAICDRWFASVPGPTWVNRFFVHTGTARGIARMPNDKWDLEGYALHDQRTVYDELNAHGKSWRIYFHDAAQTLALTHQWQSQNRLNYAHIDQFEAHTAGPATDFPAFVFIEPQYAGDNPNDDHPPYDVMNGERLIARVYNAIRGNPALWQSTMLIVVFDEHGGYYDHVQPPAAPAPDRCALEYTFDRYGVRVPAILVSPWVEPGVFPADKSVYFDHTSIGRYLCDRWGLSPLGKRMSNANSIALGLRLDRPPRTDTPTEIPLLPPAQAVVAATPNENQIALDLLSRHLEGLAAGPRADRMVGAVAGAKPDPHAMRERTMRFLDRGPTDGLEAS